MGRKNRNAREAAALDASNAVEEVEEVGEDSKVDAHVIGIVRQHALEAGGERRGECVICLELPVEDMFLNYNI